MANVFDGEDALTTRDTVPGPWFLGWRLRRWENLTLGVDTEDRIVPYRPHYQYLVSFVNPAGEVVLDNVRPERGDKTGPGWAYMSFSPHTVRPIGRSCENCHWQNVTAGIGLGEGGSEDLLLAKANPPVYPDLRNLNNREVERLLRKTPLFRRKRVRLVG